VHATLLLQQSKKGRWLAYLEYPGYGKGSDHIIIELHPVWHNQLRGAIAVRQGVQQTQANFRPAPTS
jgi:hypothetical protein